MARRQWSRSEAAAKSSAQKSVAQTERNEANHEFWVEFLHVMKQRSTLFSAIGARTGPFVDIMNGSFRYQVWVKADGCHVQLRIDGGDADENAALFDQIAEHSSEVDEAFGEALHWNRAENHRACIIRHDVEGSAGWKTPLGEREAGMVATAEAMIRFHAALDPIVSDLA